MQISKLRLKCKKLANQQNFYTQVLGFELVEATALSFTVKVGSSQLCFEQSAEAYYYHFAFNIPSFQIQEAYAWLAAKHIDCISYQENLIIDFKNWNAEAVYFYDADGNIGELIARKNQAIETSQPFSNQSILCISEIGLAVADVKAAYNLFKKHGIDQYSGDQDYFCAMGSEEGLLIIVDQKVKKWMPTELPAIPAPFDIQMIQDNKPLTLSYNGRFIKLVEPSEQQL